MDQATEDKVKQILLSPGHTRREKLEMLRTLSLQIADQLTKQKGKDYGHFSEYPLVVVAGNSLTKAKRGLHLACQMEVNPETKAQFEGIEDSFKDQINYASFAWALAMERKYGTTS